MKKQRLILWVARGMGRTGRLLKASLAEALPNKRVLMVRSTSKRFRPRETDVIINWGNSHLAGWDDLQPAQYINHMGNVWAAVNKLKCFEQLQGKVNIPEWTTDQGQASRWIDHDKETVVARYMLTGHGGQGIELFSNDTLDGMDYPNRWYTCPLFVKYKKKKKEFRVHVFNGEAIDITQKKKRKDYPGEINTKIRNIDGGWIFARQNLEGLPHDLVSQAIGAVQALGLDFGAVDIIWNEREDKSYVLEVNTAPGLVGTSLERYTQAIKENL